MKRDTRGKIDDHMESQHRVLSMSPSLLCNACQEEKKSQSAVGSFFFSVGLWIFFFARASVCEKRKSFFLTVGV